MGALLGPEPWGGHSQESGSVRRQHLPWVPVAGVRQRTPKMPEKQRANAHSQPHEGLPLLHKRRQVRDGAGGRGWQRDVGEGWGGRRPAMPGPAGFSGAEPAPGWPRPARACSDAPEAERGSEPSCAWLSWPGAAWTAGLAGTAGAAVPTQPPPSRASPSPRRCAPGSPRQPRSIAGPPSRPSMGTGSHRSLAQGAHRAPGASAHRYGARGRRGPRPS